MRDELFKSSKTTIHRDMFGTVLAIVYNVSSHARETGGVCHGAAGILIFPRFANCTVCGGVQKFFPNRAKFTIFERVMFGTVLAVVYNVTSCTRQTGSVCQGAGVLIFPRFANCAVGGG